MTFQPLNGVTDYPCHGLTSCQFLTSYTIPFSTSGQARNRQTDRRTDRQRLSKLNVPRYGGGGIIIITSCKRAAATICPRPCTPHAAAQLQPIHALHLACGAQRALLPVAVGATNIHDVRASRQTDDRCLQTRIIA